MRWWIFQINPKKILESGETYDIGDLKEEIAGGSMEWPVRSTSYYRQVQAEDKVLIRMTETNDTKYSGTIVGTGTVMKCPKDTDDTFEIRFDKRSAESLLENPLDFNEVKSFIHPDVTLNKTIIPVDSSIHKMLNNKILGG